MVTKYLKSTKEISSLLHTVRYIWEARG